MKEINILCVEDGSVDVVSLEDEGLHDGKVLIYRQGATPPFVLKLKTDDGELKSEQNKVAECTLTDGYNCSLCGASQADIRKKYSNFCSNCGAKIKANSQSFYGPFYSLPELNENNLIFATEEEAQHKLKELEVE